MTATAPESVANTYVGIDDLKARMGIAGTSNDSVLWMTLNAASRAVDRHCNRHFFALEATRLFDIDDPASVALPDLVSITEVLEDRVAVAAFQLIADEGVDLAMFGQQSGAVNHDVRVE